MNVVGGMVNHTDVRLPKKQINELSGTYILDYYAMAPSYVEYLTLRLHMVTTWQGGIMVEAVNIRLPC
jgi:hypothetical protein